MLGQDCGDTCREILGEEPPGPLVNHLVSCCQLINQSAVYGSIIEEEAFNGSSDNQRLHVRQSSALGFVSSTMHTTKVTSEEDLKVPSILLHASGYSPALE